MKTIFLDVETTTKAKGNPFHEDNKLCLVGIRSNGVNYIYDIEHSNNPYNESLLDIKRRIEEADLIVGFNIKFDLHWIKRYIHDIRFHSVWDCQLGAFIRSNQRTAYPSLEDISKDYHLPPKLGDTVNEFWNNGIDTDSIPREILDAYLSRDLENTEGIYLGQLPELKNNKIFTLGNKQLLVLQEMEYNGMVFDEAEAAQAEKDTQVLLDKVLQDLDALYPNPKIDWGSTDQISCVLYGGTVKIPCRVQTTRILKDGSIKLGEKNGIKLVELPRLVDPLKRSETLPSAKYDDYSLTRLNEQRKKEGKVPIVRTYSVDKNTLKTLRAKGKAKSIIALLLRRADLEKLQSTYFRGIPKKIRENGWKPGTVHGTFNQCVAVTGRLSCTNPNQQNFDKRIKRLFKSRYL